jgi:D-sedoheptulose 7-phosphate isomerase
MSTFDLATYWNAERASHLDASSKTFDHLQDPFTHMLEACALSVKSGGKILFFGNGGSAADAQHLATELTIRFIKDRKPIPAIALTTDTSALTAAGNDLGFDHIFSRQIQALGNSGDIAIGISTSGNSPNILAGLKAAKENGLKTIGLTGRDGGAMKPLCDVILIVPSDVTARIQEMHITLGHMLCGALEKRLGLV